MDGKNLLAILRLGDEKNYLMNDFLESLPKGARIISNTVGFTGSLAQNLDGFKDRNKRRFIILRGPSFEKLDTAYFSSTLEAALMEIPDELRVRLDYKQQETDFTYGNRVWFHYEGSIDNMVAKYRKLEEQEPKDLLARDLKESEKVRGALTYRNIWGRTKVVPTFVSVGLETIDGKFLLDTTGAKGPYVGSIPK